MSQIFIHPSYNSSTFDNDIALIKLSTPLTLNQNVKPIEYANDCNLLSSYLNPGNVTKLSGWGATTGSPPFVVSTLLKGVQIPIISNTDANFLNASSQNVTSNMIAFYQIGSGAAPGDSGGPAVVNANGKPILIGASSWGLTPKDQKPTIYTRIKNYANWIQNTSGIAFFPSSIQGPAQFCNTATYTIPNLPVGATVVWSATGSINITGSNTVNPVSISKNFNGTGTVIANIISSCGNRTLSLPVSVGSEFIHPENQIGNFQILLASPNMMNVNVYRNNSSPFSPNQQVQIPFNGAQNLTATSLDNSMVSVSNNTVYFTFFGYETFGNIQVNYNLACSSFSQNVIFNLSELPYQYRVFPNPANNELNISYEQIESKTNSNPISLPHVVNFNVEIYDNKAKKLISQNNSITDNNITLNTQNLPNGIYHLHINDGKETFKKQIVIQH